ncbi:MAG: metalloregulator ArsR/SmtB family transcription factor [Desulfobacteraceae bacterium]|nr:metalloregulator ArsR/SmtB family transcription factor [Desulfobacteraceae bacterium]
MKKLAQFIKILGDTTRLSIIGSIGKKTRSVTEIINDTGLSQTLVSFHLRNLRDAGIVTTRRDGPFIYYSLTNLSLIDILDELALLAGLKTNFFETSQVLSQGKIVSVNRR